MNDASSLRPRRTLPWLALVVLPLLLAAVAPPVCSSLARRAWSDPWYRLADADAAYAGQAILLANDGDATFLHHPGATVYSVQAGIHRLLARFDRRQADVLTLDRRTSRDEVVPLLTTAVATGRAQAIGTIALIGILFYLGVRALSGGRLVSLLFTFALASSPALLWHADVIRPESTSVAFAFAAGLCLFHGASRSASPARTAMAFFAAGLSLGLAILSKIQVAPLCALTLAAVFLLLVTRRSDQAEQAGAENRAAWLAVGMAALALAAAPYWALVRPPFLTAERFLMLDPNDQAVFARLPSSFGPAIGVVLLLQLAAVAILASRPAWRARLARVALLCAAVSAGAIAAAYLVLIPASCSTSGWVNNTNALLYATLSNLTGGGGGFLRNQHLTLTSSLLQVWQLHSGFTRLAGIDLPLLVVAAAIFCGFRLATGNRAWGLPLVFLGGGLLMDLVGTLRLGEAYRIYGVYSVPLYMLGLANVTVLCWRSASAPGAAVRVVGGVLIGLAAINVPLAAYRVVHPDGKVLPRASYGEPFAWTIIEVYEAQIPRYLEYARLRQAACGGSPVLLNRCGFPGGVRAWLEARGESRRSDGQTRATPAGQNFNGWWVTGLRWVRSQGQESDQPLLQINFWPPPWVPTESAGEAAIEHRERRLLVPLPQSPVAWAGNARVGMRDLAAAVPSLVFQGAFGEFAFLPGEPHGRRIAIVPTALAVNQESAIQIGLSPALLAGTSARAGQFVFAGMRSRVVGGSGDAACLFVKERGGARDRSVACAADSDFRQTLVIHRLGMDGADIGLYWRPRSLGERLELDGLWAASFEACTRDDCRTPLTWLPPIDPAQAR